MVINKAPLSKPCCEKYGSLIPIDEMSIQAFIFSSYLDFKLFFILSECFSRKNSDSWLQESRNTPNRICYATAGKSII